MEVGIQDTLIVKEGFQIQENLLLAEPNKHQARFVRKRSPFS